VISALPSPSLATLLLSIILAACSRTLPPAPVVAGGQSGGPSTTSTPVRSTAGVAHRAISHPDKVTVRSGETLYAISRRYDVPVRSLIEANGLAPPYNLGSGRNLAVPQVRQHVIQTGDTLYSVSRLYGVDTSTLAHANGIGAPYVVRIGQALVLPAPVETAGTRIAAPVIQATAPAAAYAGTRRSRRAAARPCRTATARCGGKDGGYGAAAAGAAAEQRPLLPLAGAWPHRRAIWRRRGRHAQ
jgi:LysM repeat protein